MIDESRLEELIELGIIQSYTCDDMSLKLIFNDSQSLHVFISGQEESWLSIE